MPYFLGHLKKAFTGDISFTYNRRTLFQCDCNCFNYHENNLEGSNLDYQQSVTIEHVDQGNADFYV